MTRRLVWIAPCLLLAACHHGGTAATTTTSTNASPGGIYTGTLTSTASGATYSVVGAIGEDGTLQLINTTTSAQYSGQLAVSNTTTATGTLAAYTAAGAYATNGPFSGTVTERTRIGGVYSLANGDSGNLSLSYGALYAVPQSLATAAGSYRWTSTRNGGTSTLTLGSGGAITGITEYGCQFTGTATVPNASFDLFALALTYGTNTGCGAASGTTLNGLAYYTPANGSTVATLTAAATNGTAGTFALYQRQ